MYCHFNFTNSPSERRLMLVPSSNDVVSKLSNLDFPVVVRVLRSVIFQCHPDEVVERDQEILLCRDFSVLHDHTLSHVVPPANPDVEDLNFAPLLDLDNVVCNCTTYADIGPVILNVVLQDTSLEDNDDQERVLVGNGVGSESSSEVEEVEEEEEDWEDELEEEDVIHTLPFKCIGAAHERTRQQHLETAEEVIRNGGSVKVKLRPEEDNQYDKFAIAIDIDYGSDWFHAGYIARELTKYIHPLMETNKIVSVSLEHIKFRVHFAKIGFYPKVLITRKGAWESFVVNRSRSVR